MVQIYKKGKWDYHRALDKKIEERDFHFTRPTGLSPFIDLLVRPQQAPPALDRLIMGDLYPGLFYIQHSGPISPAHMQLHPGEEEEEIPFFSRR